MALALHRLISVSPDADQMGVYWVTTIHSGEIMSVLQSWVFRLAALLFISVNSAHAATLLQECNGEAAQINQSAPQVIDRITTLKSAICFQDSNAVVLQYRMQLSVTGDQVNLGLIKPNMISTWCSDPQLLPMLKVINIQYAYTDPQGKFIGRIDISRRDCR